VVEGQLKAARLADSDFGFSPPPQNAVGEVEEVLLEPGDVLYHPAGVWHQVQVAEPGVSINVSLIAVNYAQFTCPFLEPYLCMRKEWRQCISNNSNDPNRASAVETLQSLLQDLPGVLQDFVRQGGAQAILSPVLQSAAAAASANTQSSEQDDDVDSDEEEEEEGEEDVIAGDSFQAPTASTSASNKSSSVSTYWLC